MGLAPVMVELLFQKLEEIYNEIDQMEKTDPSPKSRIDYNWIQKKNSSKLHQLKRMTKGHTT